MIVGFTDNLYRLPAMRQGLASCVLLVLYALFALAENRSRGGNGKMRAWNKRFLAALSTLVMLAAGWTAGSAASANEQTTFKQGEGYAAGKYDIQAAQPTTDNWERRSRYAAIAGGPPKLKWRLATGYWAESAPVIGSDGTIYAVDRNLSGKPKVIALHDDGTVKWTFTGQADTAFNGSPVIAADGTLYVSSSASLYAIHSGTGKEKWRRTVGKSLSSPAIAADGTIYVGAENGTLYAIQPTDGAVKWTTAPFGHSSMDLQQTTPVIGKDGTIYTFACNYENVEYFLIAIDPVSRKMKWKRNMLDAMYGSPIIGADGTIYAASAWGFLFAIRPDGVEKWRFNAQAPITSSPAIGADGTIYTGTSGAYLYAVNPNGLMKWKFVADADHALQRAPLIDANGTIYMASVLRDGQAADGYLYAIKSDGSQKWIYKVARTQVGGDWFADLSEPAIGADGTIYFGTSAKEFYAVHGVAPLLEAVDPSHSGAPVPEATEEVPQPEASAAPQPEAAPGPASEQPPAFIDMAGHWAEKAVLEAARRQTVSGFLDGTYRPNQAVTRAQFTTMLARALGIEAPDQALSFTDADAIPSWARGAVAAAVKLGYVQGDSGGAFRPEARMTRAEMAAVIAKVLKLDAVGKAATSFADDADIPSWAKGAVEAARQQGVVAGRSGNRFDPAATVTRAEAAVILLRVVTPIE